MSAQGQGLYREVQLAKGRGVALVDAEDYEWASQFRWHLTQNGYVRRGLWPRGVAYMHREIIGASREFEVDHRNGVRTDNRRCNLRPASRMQQSANAPKYRGALSSKYKGVSRKWYVSDVTRDPWRAKINAGRQIHLGYFATEIEAARAYDRAAREHFGEFAYLNFPDETSHVA